MARRPKKSEEVKADAGEKESVIESSEEVVDVDAETEAVSNAEVDADQVQCGQAFIAARIDSGLTTKDVAKQLRLSSTQIEALEQDDFASLPEATIVKGFIRNYAKLLKIPAEPLINAYVEMVPPKQDYAFALNPGINMKITESSKSYMLRYLLIAIGLLLAIGVWFFYQNYVQKPNPVNPMPEEEAPAAVVLPELALPMSERLDNASATQLEMPAKTEVNETTDQDQAIDVGASAETAETSKAEGNVEATPASEEATAPTKPDEVLAEEETPPVLGKTRLEFTATQETWLSVVNTSGREVYNKILYAGGRDVVDIRQPAEIVVGNAHGAKLVIDGKPIDLAPYTRVNVARVRMNRLR